MTECALIPRPVHTRTAALREEKNPGAAIISHFCRMRTPLFRVINLLNNLNVGCEWKRNYRWLRMTIKRRPLFPHQNMSNMNYHTYICVHIGNFSSCELTFSCALFRRNYLWAACVMRLFGLIPSVVLFLLWAFSLWVWLIGRWVGGREGDVGRWQCYRLSMKRHHKPDLNSRPIQLLLSGTEWL